MILRIPISANHYALWLLLVLRPIFPKSLVILGNKPTMLLSENYCRIITFCPMYKFSSFGNVLPKGNRYLRRHHALFVIQHKMFHKNYILRKLVQRQNSKVKALLKNGNNFWSLRRIFANSLYFFGFYPLSICIWKDEIYFSYHIGSGMGIKHAITINLEKMFYGSVKQGKLSGKMIIYLAFIEHTLAKRLHLTPE